MYTLELGPIRPPSEAQSILLRLTRNCPWNKCEFCHSYKNCSFSIRPIEEIKNDIDTIKLVSDHIDEIVSDSLHFSIQNIQKIITRLTDIYAVPYTIAEYVSYWKLNGLKHVFLQDADSLVMKYPTILEILKYLNQQIHTVERITTYARSKTISKFSTEEVATLKEYGLTRIHIGIESGSNEVLNVIQKGVTSDEHIKAGKSIKQAGIELSVYYIPGAGGKELLSENALQSANVMNQINPDFIRIRSIVPLPDTHLYTKHLQNKWILPGEIDKVKDLKIFIENLNNIHSYIASDHIVNLFSEINGKLPSDKKDLLSILDSFLKAPLKTQESFIVAKRFGLADTFNDFTETKETESIVNQLKVQFTSIDEAILQILWKYI